MLSASSRDYRRLNPDIGEAALVVDDVIQISTDAKKVGKPWQSESRNFEYEINLSRSNNSRVAYLVVTAPTAVVYNQVERSVRNFAALFVASAFLAGLFLQVANSMQRLRMSKSAVGQFRATRRQTKKPALSSSNRSSSWRCFLSICCIRFCPSSCRTLHRHSGFSLAYAAAPFTAYYLCFALSLIPAGRFAEKHGPRALIWGGLILAGSSVLGLGLPLDIAQITVLRGISGIGQGMLFIGVQAYILAVASPEKKTQGAAIIVFGFQGGMISGMAIGSLLVNLSGAARGVPGQRRHRTCGRGLLRPADPARDRANSELQRAAANFGIVNGLKHVLRNGEFLKTMFCIGVPAKAILTGTITFALPLLLGQHGYRQEDIGQIIMLYAMSVVAASSLISRLVDQTGNTTTILFLGAATSGAGLVLLGLMGSPLVGDGIARLCHRHPRRHFGRHRSRLYQCTGGDARRSLRAGEGDRRQFGDHDLSLRGTHRPRGRPGFDRSIVPDLGTKPANPHGIGIAVAILGFLFLIQNFSSPRRGPWAGGCTMIDQDSDRRASLLRDSRESCVAVIGRRPHCAGARQPNGSATLPSSTRPGQYRRLPGNPLQFEIQRKAKEKGRGIEARSGAVSARIVRI